MTKPQQDAARVELEPRVHDRAERMDWFKREVLVHEPALRRFLRRVNAPSSDLDDMVSEALTRAYAIDEWRRISNGRSYLFGICRNMLMDIARRAKVVAFENVADMEALGLADGAPTAEALVSTRDDLRVLQLAVESLPPRCREIFLLRRVEEISPPEVARRLGISVRTVESHMAKAMALLAAALADTDPARGSLTVMTWRRRQTL